MKSDDVYTSNHIDVERERERENYGNRDPLLEGGGQKADRPILPPAKVTPDKPGFLRALAR